MYTVCITPCCCFHYCQPCHGPSMGVCLFRHRENGGEPIGGVWRRRELAGWSVAEGHYLKKVSHRSTSRWFFLYFHPTWTKTCGIPKVRNVVIIGKERKLEFYGTPGVRLKEKLEKNGFWLLLTTQSLSSVFFLHAVLASCDNFNKLLQSEAPKIYVLHSAMTFLYKVFIVAILLFTCYFMFQHFRPSWPMWFNLPNFRLQCLMIARLCYWSARVLPPSATWVPWVRVRWRSCEFTLRKLDVSAMLFLLMPMELMSLVSF